MKKKAARTSYYRIKNNYHKECFTDKEYSEDVERERRKLRPILRKAKQIPEFKMKSKMEGDKLIIKGKRYTSKNLHLLPQPLTGYNVSSKERDQHLGFFGELNPFSNFHEAHFELDGIKFHSSKQYIQYQKAKLFEDDGVVKKTLASSNVPWNANSSPKISRIMTMIQWKEQARTLM